MVGALNQMVAVEPSLETPCTKAAALVEELDTTEDATELFELEELFTELLDSRLLELTELVTLETLELRLDELLELVRLKTKFAES